MTASLARLMRITASTKRPPVISGGMRGEPATQVVSLKCTPLDVVSAELQERLQLDTAYELLQTFTLAADIKEGDYLVVGSTEYPIRAVEDWGAATGGLEAYKRLILEDLKR